MVQVSKERWTMAGMDMTTCTKRTCGMSADVIIDVKHGGKIINSLGACHTHSLPIMQALMDKGFRSNSTRSAHR